MGGLGNRRGLALIGGKMIHEYVCRSGHEFELWHDDNRVCPGCGGTDIKRVFRTPPNIGTGKPARVDALVRGELEARGITNIQGGGHEGDREKVTYKSTPEQLAADKIFRDFPVMNDKSELQRINQSVIQKWTDIGVKGVIKSGLGKTTHENTLAAIGGAGAHDRIMTRRVVRRDPENLTIKK
jgi:hypothetical protein